MAAKALIEVDIRIALLREEEDSIDMSSKTAELRELLKQRDELLPKMLAERFGDFPMAA